METKKLDLYEILKDCQEGSILYSPLFGDVNFVRVLFTGNILVHDCYGCSHEFYSDGTVSNLPKAECMLFPSKENRDWSTWKNPNVKIKHFDPKTLKPFDKVLVKNDYYWIPTILSYYDNWDKTFVTILYKEYWKCIPYNDETAHLAGTTDEAPKYYRYWED